ncbi:hypothetical protein DFAR_1390018 [Desulfarculales bacterium]
MGGGGQGCYREVAFGVGLLRALGLRYHYNALDPGAYRPFGWAAACWDDSTWAPSPTSAIARYSWPWV